MNMEKIDQKVFDLYDDYAHNKIDRRSFIDRLSIFAVGGLTVPALLNHILPDYETTAEVPINDPRLTTTFPTYESSKGGGEIRGQLSFLKEVSDTMPGIIVVHENRGLNPYIEDVGRRAALEGFISFAPDALWPLGGYPGNDDEGRTLQRKRDKNEMLEDFIAAFEYLKSHPKCNGNIGVVGFCFGGWISNMMATKVSDLKAAVPFYGGAPPLETVKDINSPLLLQFGELDTRVNAGWEDYEKELINQKKVYNAYIYPGANHGFHNNTTPRYDEKNAHLAWERTISFFKEHLV
jgi:carboxymethylenebutenolidase